MFLPTTLHVCGKDHVTWSAQGDFRAIAHFAHVVSICLLDMIDHHI